MTHKEKAQKIIDGFNSFPEINVNQWGNSNLARMCAKICCQEIIAAIDENGVHASKHFATVKEYYNNVLKEIDLL